MKKFIKTRPGSFRVIFLKDARICEPLLHNKEVKQTLEAMPVALQKAYELPKILRWSNKNAKALFSYFYEQNNLFLC